MSSSHHATVLPQKRLPSDGPEIRKTRAYVGPFGSRASCSCQKASEKQQKHRVERHHDELLLEESFDIEQARRPWHTSNGYWCLLQHKEDESACKHNRL